MENNNELEKMKAQIEEIKKLIRENYMSHACGWTSMRSGSNTSDVFEDGQENGRSCILWAVACILNYENKLEEPEEPNNEW